MWLCYLFDIYMGLLVSAVINDRIYLLFLSFTNKTPKDAPYFGSHSTPGEVFFPNMVLCTFVTFPFHLPVATALTNKASDLLVSLLGPYHYSCFLLSLTDALHSQVLWVWIWLTSMSISLPPHNLEFGVILVS